MPEKILIITVGGSCEPIVNAVKADAYDKVYFICSGGKKGSEITVDGAGLPCKDFRGGDAKPSIAAQTGLEPEAYEKIVLTKEEIDDLAACYARLEEAARRISDAHPGALVTANYTGGTKTMSAVLVMVAVRFGWSVQLNQGVRTDLVKVRHGDVAVLQSADPLKSGVYAVLAQKALSSWDYSMAASVAEELLRQGPGPEIRNSWLTLRTLCLGFAAWDAFRYGEALEILQGLGRFIGSWLGTLRSLADGSRHEHGYTVVGDLLNNAARRADQERFDDAVSRLYRATELLAQVRLKEAHGLESGAIGLAELEARLSPDLMEEYRARAGDDGIIKIGLHETYQLLERLSDPLGQLFMERESRILDTLRVRNLSFLAHGFRPVTTADYNRVRQSLEGFILDGLRRIAPGVKTPDQLPGPELMEASGLDGRFVCKAGG